MSLHPQDVREIKKAIREFPTNPTQAAKDLAAVGRRSGYDTIQPTLMNLDQTMKLPGAIKVIPLLRQPEWVWKATNDPTVSFIHLPDVHGKMQARAYYVSGKFETGGICVLDKPDNTGAYTMGDVIPDQRAAYVPRRVKLKLMPSGNKGLRVAAVGRVVDLLRTGIKQADVIWTQGRGYFANSAAYAELTEPMYDIDKAREVRDELKLTYTG